MNDEWLHSNINPMDTRFNFDLNDSQGNTFLHRVDTYPYGVIWGVGQGMGQLNTGSPFGVFPKKWSNNYV